VEKVTKATKRNSFKDDSMAWCRVLTGRRTMIDVWYVYSVYGMSMYSIVYIYIYTRIYVCVSGHPGEYGMVKESSLKRKYVSKIPYSIYFRVTI